MFSKHDEIWARLRSSIKFDAYADTRLASLYLDNEDFPPHLLVKVFDVILDPKFKSQDVTFKSFSNLLERISEHRAQDTALSASKDVACPPTTPTSRFKDNSSPGIPSVVLSHVVDRMVEGRLPLGIVATGWSWRVAYKATVADFHSLSLVHPSWTPIARRGLRRRAVIPYHQINNFLVSPFCGSWITEMIVYWNVDNGKIGVTLGDVVLFEALLKRLPALRSLAFNTCLVWPKDEIGYGSYLSSMKPPPFHVDSCLKLVADLSPKLEHLWLRHFKGDVRRETVQKHYSPVAMERTLELCPELASLCTQLPRMRSLKFLSIHRWTGLEKGRELAKSDESPSSTLKTIVLDNSDDSEDYRYGEKFIVLDNSDDSEDYRYGEDEEDTVVVDNDGRFKWLLEPRGDFRLSTLSLTVHDWSEEEISSCLPSLDKLQLSVQYALDEVVYEQCNQLTNLELLISKARMLEKIQLPASLHHLTFHFHDTTLQKLVRNGSSGFTGELAKQIPSLPHPRTLTFIEPPPDSYKEFEGGELDGFVYRLPLGIRKGVSKKLTKLCDEHNIRLSVRYAVCISGCYIAPFLG